MYMQISQKRNDDFKFQIIITNFPNATPQVPRFFSLSLSHTFTQKCV